MTEIVYCLLNTFLQTNLTRYFKFVCSDFMYFKILLLDIENRNSSIEVRFKTATS